jgi:hypothetical protein
MDVPWLWKGRVSAILRDWWGGRWGGG